MVGCTLVPLQFTLHLNYSLHEIHQKKPHTITISLEMKNQLTITINFSHHHYTNFDRDKLFLEKSTIILISKVSYLQGELRISETIRRREV